MPHYLARVAAAATRTTTAAKPPVAAPPLMPGFGHAGAMLPPPSLPEDTWRFLDEYPGRSLSRAGADPEEPAPLPTPISVPAGAAPLNALPTNTGENTLPTDQIATTPLPPNQGTRDVRPSSPGTMAAAVEAVFASPSQAMPLNALPANEREHMPPADQVAPASLPPSQGNRDTKPGLPGTMAAAVEALLAGPPQAVPIIRAPRALRPAQKLNLPLPQGDQEAQSFPMQPPVPQASARADAPALRASERAQEQRTPAMPTARSGIGAMCVPLPQANTLELPAATSGKRQSRITIGQIDVQVHNRPSAPIIARPTASASLITSDSLEQRYLDRFRLKL